MKTVLIASVSALAVAAFALLIWIVLYMAQFGGYLGWRYRPLPLLSTGTDQLIVVLTAAVATFALVLYRHRASRPRQ
jgi:hypothetical protein